MCGTMYASIVPSIIPCVVLHVICGTLRKMKIKTVAIYSEIDKEVIKMLYNN